MSAFSGPPSSHMAQTSLHSRRVPRPLRLPRPNLQPRHVLGALSHGSARYASNAMEQVRPKANLILTWAPVPNGIFSAPSPSAVVSAALVFTMLLGLRPWWRRIWGAMRQSKLEQQDLFAEVPDGRCHCPCFMQNGCPGVLPLPVAMCAVGSERLQDPVPGLGPVERGADNTQHCWPYITAGEHDDEVMVWLSSSDQTRQLGMLLARLAQPGDVVALVGDLGAGKTCIARGFIREFMGQPHLHVPSPTYLLCLTYSREEVRVHLWWSPVCGFTHPLPHSPTYTLPKSPLPSPALIH